MKVEHVPAQYFHVSWPLVEEYIDAAMEYSCGECSTEQAKVFLSQGMWDLFVFVEGDTSIVGAAAVQFVNRANDRVAMVTAVGGRGLFTRKGIAAFSDMMRRLGATTIEGAQRPSVARLWARFGAKTKYSIQEVRL